jgi:two-component system sensor histidine kinase KdpD
VLVLAFVAAAATAALLGAALAQVGPGRGRDLILLSIVAFVGTIAAGGMLALQLRHRDAATDPLLERAQTASKLSHELKNPLLAIKGLASTGARMYDRMQDEERREFFELIDEEAGRLKRIVEQAATAMKVDAGQVVYDVREEDLGALVEQVAWATPHGTHPMSVQSDPGICVRADRRYLSEVVEILIDNASKFSPPDAPIEVTVRGADGLAHVEVADRGPGIPPERVEQVFERFGRWRPPGYEETPGAGLGLFLARAHLRAHTGRVDVADRDDGGTILRITLPSSER